MVPSSRKNQNQQQQVRVFISGNVLMPMMELKLAECKISVSGVRSSALIYASVYERITPRFLCVSLFHFGKKMLFAQSFAQCSAS